MSTTNDKALSQVEIANKLMAEMQAQVGGGSNDTRQLKESFKNITPDEKPKIPQVVFESIFLPVIQGKVETTNDDDDRIIDHWIGLVGATNPAEVVNTSGEVIFTVPPLVSSDAIDLDKKSKIASAMIDYSATATVNPVRAKGELIQNMANDLSSRFKTSGEEYSWDSMLEYYGKKANSGKPGDIAKPSTEFDFDDA